MCKGYHRSIRPKSEIDSNIIAAINSLVEEDATNKVHVLVETFVISSGVVFQIVHQWFGMRKIYNYSVGPPCIDQSAEGGMFKISPAIVVHERWMLSPTSERSFLMARH
jgi:hypothetical protein